MVIDDQPLQSVSPWLPLGNGIHSVVWRARNPTNSLRRSSYQSLRTINTDTDPVDDLPNWVAVKVVYDNRAMPPHDIVREAAILRSVSHTNIIALLGFIREAPDAPYALYMPLIPVPLTILLSSPLFSPTPLTGPYSAFSRAILTSPQQPGESLFTTVAKSLVYQLLLAVSYLHSLDPPIAHRDINPENILIDREGTVKLIDFGIAWSPGHSQTTWSSGAPQVDESSRHPFDGWTETPENMCCQVATGSHRAPELLFSPLVYSAVAVDIWSLGTTISQFFTPLRIVPSQSPISSPGSVTSDEADEAVSSPFLIPSSLRTNIDYRATWERTTLFNGERGELGLAWSIFKLRGTPDENSWPSFNKLPDVSKIEFHKATRKPLHTVLPHLPPCPPSAGPMDCSSEAGSPVSLIDALLAYPPQSRLPAAQALLHPWFSSNLLLPVSYPGLDPSHGDTGNHSIPRGPRKGETQWRGRTLGEWLEPVTKRAAHRLTRREAQNP